MTKERCNRICCTVTDSVTVLMSLIISGMGAPKTMKRQRLRCFGFAAGRRWWRPTGRSPETGRFVSSAVGFGNRAQSADAGVRAGFNGAVPLYMHALRTRPLSCRRKPVRLLLRSISASADRD